MTSASTSTSSAVPRQDYVPHPTRLGLGQRPVGHRARVQDRVEHAHAHVLVAPPGEAPPLAREQLALEHVREGAVAEVVAQPRQRDGLDVPALDVDLAALQPPHAVGVLPGQVRDAQRVLEPVVARAGEHKVGGPSCLRSRRRWKAAVSTTATSRGVR